MTSQDQPGQMMLPYQEREIPELLTIKQAAKRIGIHYRKLLDAVNEGAVPHYRLGQSRRMVSAAEVVSIMKNEGDQNGKH